MICLIFPVTNSQTTGLRFFFQNERLKHESLPAVSKNTHKKKNHDRIRIAPPNPWWKTSGQQFKKKKKKKQTQEDPYLRSKKIRGHVCLCDWKHQAVTVSPTQCCLKKKREKFLPADLQSLALIEACSELLRLSCGRLEPEWYSDAIKKKKKVKSMT